MSKYQKYYLEIKPLYFDIKGMLNLLFNKTFNTHNRTPNHLNKSTTDKRMCVVYIRILGYYIIYVHCNLKFYCYYSKNHCYYNKLLFMTDCKFHRYCYYSTDNELLLLQ